ncbi:hypothetical protein ACVB8X_13560 [Streptomyces sp. NRAIS4]
MSASPSPRSWHEVGSRQEFAAYLGFLADDCERACTGDSTARPAVLPWGNRTIDDFLRGWVRLLGSRAGGGIVVSERAPGEPGWRGLACLVDGARTASPRYDRVLADPATGPDEVDSAEGLRGYAAELALGFRRDERERQARADRGEWAGEGDTWAHSTLYHWLDAWSRWVTAESPLHARLEPVTWHSVALQLGAAQGYE